MDDRDRLRPEQDPEAAQHSLHRHEEHRGDAERPHPPPPLAAPEGEGEPDREQADQGPEEPVAVFIEDTADHLRPRVEE